MYETTSWGNKVLTSVTLEMSGIYKTKAKGRVCKHLAVVDNIFLSYGVLLNNSENTVSLYLNFEQLSKQMVEDVFFTGAVGG